MYFQVTLVGIDTNSFVNTTEVVKEPDHTIRKGLSNI